MHYEDTLDDDVHHSNRPGLPVPAFGTCMAVAASSESEGISGSPSRRSSIDASLLSDNLAAGIELMPSRSRPCSKQAPAVLSIAKLPRLRKKRAIATTSPPHELQYAICFTVAQTRDSGVKKDWNTP